MSEPLAGDLNAVSYMAHRHTGLTQARSCVSCHPLASWECQGWSLEAKCQFNFPTRAFFFFKKAWAGKHWDQACALGVQQPVHTLLANFKTGHPLCFSSSSIGVQCLWHCFVPVCRAEPLRLGRWPGGVGRGGPLCCRGRCGKDVNASCERKKKGKCYSSVVLKGPIFFQEDCKREIKGKSPKSVYALPSPGGQRGPSCPAPPAALPLQSLQSLWNNGTVRKGP